MLWLFLSIVWFCTMIAVDVAYFKLVREQREVIDRLLDENSTLRRALDEERSAGNPDGEYCKCKIADLPVGVITIPATTICRRCGLPFVPGIGRQDEERSVK
jgi:hypothetical protein